MMAGSRLTRCMSLCHSSLPPSPSPASAAILLQNIASTQPTGVAKVVLKRGKTQLFKEGNPMVYSGAIDRIIGRPPPVTGDVVLVADGTEKPIGWGLYNSASMFSVRLMQLEDEISGDPSCALNVEKLLETRIDAAIQLRKNLGLPSASTNAYRLVNSEGDRLSGLIIDIFGDVAVIASSAAWVEKYKPQIKRLASKIDKINSISWRPSIEILKEEGLDLSPYPLEKSSTSIGSVKVVENDVSYLISLEGQKTGFFADQRESRQFISTISEGQRVLDMCCYTGGFALNAARGGALNVTGVDTSSPALELASKNILLNNLNSESVSFVRQDATEFMKDAVSRNESWDIVILDPPKLAPRRKEPVEAPEKIHVLMDQDSAICKICSQNSTIHFPGGVKLKVLHSAAGMYRNLNSLAMQLTKRGGFLMTCSCSGAMTQSGTFLRVLQGAASMSGRKITVVREAGASCDHPIDPSYPEGAYLTNILLRVL